MSETVDDSPKGGIAVESGARRASFVQVLRVLALGRGLGISPTVVFLSFVFWAWLLGGPGAFLALPMTLFVAVMLDTFPETRWLANVVGVSASGKGERSV